MSWLSLLLPLVLQGTPETSWPGFRNEGRCTLAAGSLPREWSPEQGIAWQKPIPGYGQSSPVIWENRVYVTSMQGDEKETSLLSAFDLAKGELVWSKALPASSPKKATYSVARAAPSPLADAEGVYAFFETGDLVAYSHQGKQLWVRSLVKDYGEFDSGHGLGSSPAQTENAVILLVEHRGPSYLLAIDKASGKTLWKTDRPTGTAWSSPVVIQTEQGELIIASSNGAVHAYKASSGEEVWNVDGLTGNNVPSPTVQGSRIYIGAAPGRSTTEESQVAASNCCVELSSEGTAAKLLWQSERALSHYASPVVAGKFVYFVNKVGILYCLDAETGKELYRNRLNIECWATPIAVGDQVYFFGKDGTTVVLKAGEQFEVVSRNRLWNPNSPPEAAEEPEEPGNRGAELLQRLLENGANNDGSLSKEEIPQELRPLVASGDQNQDQALDAEELKALQAQLQERGQSSRQSVAGTVLYGVAAVDGSLILRTGSHLFCVRATP